MRLYTPFGEPIEVPDNALNGGAADGGRDAAERAELAAYRRQGRFDAVVAEHGFTGVSLGDLDAGAEITPKAVRAVVDTRDRQAAGLHGFDNVDDYRDVRARLTRGERPEPPPPSEWTIEDARGEGQSGVSGGAGAAATNG